MHRVPNLLATACYCLLPVTVAAAHPTHAADNPSSGFAVLVGIDQYTNLGAEDQLQGAKNDVELLATLLRHRFRFAPNDIVTLVNEAATGQGIRLAMERLAARLNSLPHEGDVIPVVLHFSGHGSQLPDQDEGHADRDESDGLDETLVPADATESGGSQDIRDDELNRILHSLCTNPRVRLWMILDCCHSATGGAGVVQTKWRLLHRMSATRSGIPDTTIAAASGATLRKTLPDNAVVLSACRANQLEPEYRDGDKTYGLLTRFLVQTLMDSRAPASMTYRQLIQSIEHRYLLEGIGGPSPQLEGHVRNLTAPVLGMDQTEETEPTWKAERLLDNSKRVRLQAGRLHGLGVGDLCELFGTAEDAAKGGVALSWLRITTAELQSSEADVITWDDNQSRYLEHSLPIAFKGRLRSPSPAGEPTVPIAFARRDS